MLKNRFALGLITLAVIGVDAAFAQQDIEIERLEDLELQQTQIQRARVDMEQARRQLEESARVLATQVQVLPETEGGLNFVLQNDFVWNTNRSQIGVSIVDAEDGALVTLLTPGSGAEEEGIQVGDIIQSIDGIELADGEASPNAQLVARLREVEPGDSVNLIVERAGETLDFEVETEEGSIWTAALSGVNRNYARVLRNTQRQGGDDVQVDVNVLSAPGSGNNFIYRTLGFASSPWGDMELVTVTEELGRYFDADEGLLVVSSPEDDAIDIQDGDVILAISGRTPNSPEHAIRILSSFEAGETIEFSLMRDGRRESIEYLIPESNFDIRRQSVSPVPQVFPVPVQ